VSSRNKFWFALLLSFLLIWISFFTYHKYLQSRVRKKSQINTIHGIDSLEKIKLGGINQWILIRSWDISNPIILFLHGGPGALLFTYAREIGVQAKLEKNFTMVYWEQRGCGKSFSPSIEPESMTIEQLVLDTQELTHYLCHRFNRNKLILVARSFGTLIAMRAVHHAPDLYYAYVGIGQLIYPLANDSITYRLTLQMAARYNNSEALKDLEEIGYPPFNFKELLVQRKWLTFFSDQILNNTFATSKQPPRYKLLSTPEYSITDILKIGLDPKFALRHLWNKRLYQINFHEEIRSLKVPVFFVDAVYDHFTSQEQLQLFYNNLNAKKGKKLFRFEKSGHEPERDEPARFHKIMIENVLPMVDNRPD
jgi:pimeloyl-ACP methyl ester carboxylesterase